MLHKLKPLPRGLIILAIVGGIGFALTKIEFSKPAPPVTTQAVEAPTVTTVAPPPVAPSTPLETANAAVQAANQAAQLQPAQPQAAQPAPELTPANTDAGLANVLGSKK